MAHTFFNIIITALNPGSKLEGTLRSVLEQEYGNYEILIKDGGSTDGSLRQVQGGTWEPACVRGGMDSRIRVVRQEDKGIYDGMNQALVYLKGGYVLFLNCGDRLYDAKTLARTAAFIEDAEGTRDMRERERPQIFYGDQYNERVDSRVSPAPRLNDFACYRNVPCHQVCFYDARLFAQRGYDTDFKVRADYEHFLYSIYERNAQAHYMPFIVSVYEGGGFSETKENRKRSEVEHRAAARYYLGQAKCIRYRLLLLATLAPLRTKIAQNPSLAKGYNALKSALYGRKK